MHSLVLLTMVAASLPCAGQSIDNGYRAMYNLDFAAAHRIFAQWDKSHPEDPLGPVSDAAAYLFAEFERMKILESEFFTDDNSFFHRQKSLSPDPASKQSFEKALATGEARAAAILSRSPNDQQALFASLLRTGLHADYLAFIEKRKSTTSQLALGGASTPRARLGAAAKQPRNTVL